jgi:dihydrofolate reductase
MRVGKLIQWNLISLDGYFEGENKWALDWHKTVLGEEFHAVALQQLRDAEALLFGRVTYEGMAAYWQTATDEIATYMNGLRKYVFSKTLQRADWANTQLVPGDAARAMREIKAQTKGSLYVFGSGDLSASLLEAGLFDEIRVVIAPIVLGRGTTLFGRGLNRVPFKLLESRPLSNGSIILRYRPAQEIDAGPVSS